MARRGPPKNLHRAESPFPDPIVVPVEDTLDLHSFRPDEIPELVKEYIQQCHEAGFREVRIIHGKGKGIQRQTVHAVLSRSPIVLRFQGAPLESGAWGATLCFLKPKGEA